MNGCVRLPILESYLRLVKVFRVSYPPLLGVHSADSEAAAEELKLKGQAQELGILESSCDVLATQDLNHLILGS